MTDYTQFNPTGNGLKMRGIFDITKKQAKIVHRDPAFKVIPQMMSVIGTAIFPFNLNIFNNKYILTGNRQVAGANVYSGNDIQGPWTLEATLAAVIDSAVQSETELYLYNSNVAGATANSGAVSANGSSFTSQTITTVPLNRVHLYANGLWVALGVGTATTTSLYRSTDNRIYTSVTMPAILGASMNSTATMIYFAGAHRIFFNTFSQYYSTDLGVSWSVQNTPANSSAPVLSTNNSTQHASQQQLVVVGDRLYRFFVIANGEQKGFLVCEYTLDGINWTGYRNISSLRPDLLVDQELLSVLSSGASSLSLTSFFGIPRKTAQLGVKIGTSYYVPLRSFRVSNTAYNGSSIVWELLCGVHVLQIKPDYSMEIHDVMYSKSDPSTAAQVGNIYYGNNSNNYFAFDLFKTLNDELLVHPIYPGTTNTPIITQGYLADFTAQELVLEYT